MAGDNEKPTETDKNMRSLVAYCFFDINFVAKDLKAELPLSSRSCCGQWIKLCCISVKTST